MLEEVSMLQQEIEDIIIDNTYPAKEIAEHVMEFMEWYSGMEKQKIINAYERFKKETTPDNRTDLDRQRDDYYNRDRLFERKAL